VQNRLASTISNLSNQFETASAAESRSRDLEVDKETPN
jgi:flagellin-like hook-associated protein FlgL